MMMYPAWKKRVGGQGYIREPERAEEDGRNIRSKKKKKKKKKIGRAHV